MNLVLSGPINDFVRHAVGALATPRSIVRLHAEAERFEGVRDDENTRQMVEAVCRANRIDHAYLSERKKFSTFKLLAIDMDSTLISVECIDEVADHIGKGREVSEVTDATMRGEIDNFAESLRRRVAMLAGTPTSVLADVFSHKVRLTAGASELLRAARAANIYILLLSGGFSFFSDRLREQYNLDEAHANNLAVEGSVLTGAVIEPIIDAHAKAKYVEAAIDRLGADTRDVLVIGDGANDIEMMRRAHYSIAFHARPTVRVAATSTIDFGSLATTLDYFANDD